MGGVYCAIAATQSPSKDDSECGYQREPVDTKRISYDLGNALVVSDKFHVFQNVVEACDQVQKAESPANAAKRDLLERTRWMWAKNRRNWPEKETPKWEPIALEQYRTGMAYGMRLVHLGAGDAGGKPEN